MNPPDRQTANQPAAKATPSMTCTVCVYEILDDGESSLTSGSDCRLDSHQGPCGDLDPDMVEYITDYITAFKQSTDHQTQRSLTY